MKQYFREADIAFLVYDITDGSSFQNIRNQWRKDVMDFSNNEDMYIILVGNKTDKKEERIIASRDAQRYARANHMSFIEVSAQNEGHYDLLYREIQAAVEHVLDKGGSFMYRSMQSGTNVRLPHESGLVPQGGHQQQDPQAGRQDPQAGRQDPQARSWCGSC